jgi:type I restriction enzyme, S subunit
METTKISANKKVLTPKLRFKEFRGGWEIAKLGDLVNINSGYTPSNYELSANGELPFIKVEELNNNNKYQLESRFYANSEKNIVTKDSIIFPKRGAAILNNKVRIAGKNLLIDTNLMAIKPCNSELLSEFLYYQIFNVQLYRIADCSTIPQINNKHITPYRIQLPNFEEQKKIASFLSAVDQKIQQLTRKKELLEQYKKGAMQQLFSGELRFKDKKGEKFEEWEEKNGNEIFESISDKNHKSDLPILAITQEHGAIPRHLIDYSVSVSEKSIESYKVVQIGDFIISLRSFQGGIEYSNYKGICSPAYIILRAKIKINSIFYKYYFKTDYYIKCLNKNLEGIRDGKMISFKYFSDISLPLPSLREQDKIVSFLTCLENKMQVVIRQLDSTQTFKKGLLQQMFV